MHEKDIPQRYRNLYRTAMSGHSFKAAIRAHCLMCVGWQAEEVRLCTAPTCPLYPYRLSSKQKWYHACHIKRHNIDPEATQTAEVVPE